MVSRDEVLWCYRVLLDREPESERVVQEHLTCADLETLTRVFINGPEFRHRFHRNESRSDLRVPFDAPLLPIETRASDATLAQLVARIRRAWVNLGLTQAHYSVLTAPEFLPENIASSIGQFEATGFDNAREALGMLRRHGFTDPASKTCVEYGCGVGRVTLALAAEFGHVVGYDISEAHLAHARERVRRAGIGNVRLIECANDLLEPLHPCDVFYSLIVLQHNPPPVIRKLIGNALAALNPGGFAYFQVPTQILGYRYSNEAYLADTHAPGMEMHCLPQSEIFALAAERDCEVMELREDLWTGRPDVFVSNTFVIRRSSRRRWFRLRDRG